MVRRWADDARCVLAQAPRPPYLMADLENLETAWNPHTKFPFPLGNGQEASHRIVLTTYIDSEHTPASAAGGWRDRNKAEKPARFPLARWSAGSFVRIASSDASLRVCVRVDLIFITNNQQLIGLNADSFAETGQRWAATTFARPSALT